jgi:hypothetical protein
MKDHHVPSTNCLNNGVQLTKNYRCANLVCLNQGVHPIPVCKVCARFSRNNRVCAGQYPIRSTASLLCGRCGRETALRPSLCFQTCVIMRADDDSRLVNEYVSFSSEVCAAAFGCKTNGSATACLTPEGDPAAQGDSPLLLYAERPRQRLRCALARRKSSQISIKNLRVKADLRATSQIETQPQGKCSTRRAAGLRL